MRQAGILAAACLISLNIMSKRLGEDHANARALAEGLAALPYVQIDLEQRQDQHDLLRADAGVAAQRRAIGAAAESRVRHPDSSRRRYGFRFVTHYWITREHVDQVIEALRDLLTNATAARAIPPPIKP